MNILDEKKKKKRKINLIEWIMIYVKFLYYDP